MHVCRGLKLTPLAPLAQAQGATANASAAWKQTTSSEGLREQLRKEGILGASYDSSLGQASSSPSAKLATVDSDVESTAASDAEPGAGSSVAPPYHSHTQDSPTSTVPRHALQGHADSPDAEGPAVSDRHGSIAGVDLSSSDEDSSDDFNAEVQRQLLHLTARQRLSQRGQEQAMEGLQQQQQQQQQPQAEPCTVAPPLQSAGDHETDSNSDFEIPEDISLPIEVNLRWLRLAADILLPVRMQGCPCSDQA